MFGDSELDRDGVGDCGWDGTKISMTHGTCSEDRAKVGLEEDVC